MSCCVKYLILSVVFLCLSAQAKLVCNEPVFDFGQVNEGDIVRHRFEIMNSGSKAIGIEKIKTTCGCTTATLISNTIPSRASVKLEATLDLALRSGDQDKKIRIFVVGKEEPLELSIKGFSNAIAEIKPRYLFFSQKDFSTGNSKHISIRGVKYQLEPGTPSCESPYISCSIKKGDLKNEFFLEGTVSADAPSGELSSIILLPVYDGKETLRFPVKAHVPGDIIVSPERFFFSEQHADYKMDREIEMQPGKVAKYKIVEVDCPDSTAKIDISEKGNGCFSIMLSGFSPRAVDGKSITIKTNIDGVETIEIPCKIY